jgi:hypothetical protein
LPPLEKSRTPRTKSRTILSASAGLHGTFISPGAPSPSTKGRHASGSFRIGPLQSSAMTGDATIKSHEAAQALRGERIRQNDIGWPVSLHHPERYLESRSSLCPSVPVTEPAKDRMRSNVSDPLARACAGRALLERNMRSYHVKVDGSRWCHRAAESTWGFADRPNTTRSSGFALPESELCRRCASFGLRLPT